MEHFQWPRVGAAALSIVLAYGLGACSGGGGGDNDSPPGRDNGIPALPQSAIFDSDGRLSAEIRRTTGGVPHIKADNLESLGFGAGYAQARDNVCIIADGVLRARGERARYYGPGEDDVNIISDFSFKALDLLGQAQADYPTLSEPTRALIGGFTAGYNRYLADTDPAALPSKCANQSWVRPITPEELFAYYHLVARYASGVRFASGATFMAVPPGVSPLPTPVATPGSQTAASTMAKSSLAAIKVDLDDMPMASNGWGIGAELSENGRGVLLANPHFPYTGSRRFYQAHLTIPGVLDFNGAGLIGIPIPQIGFNQHLGWTHTVTTSQRFTLYQLELSPDDDLSYLKDGEARPITSRTIRVEVDYGAPQPTMLERTFYYSEYGPMLAADLLSDAFPAWGGTNPAGKRVAFSYRDANATTASKDIDLRLGMMRAADVEQFKSAFGECGTVMWVNTIYADDQGNALYLDASAVPNLSQESLTALSQDPFRAAFAASNITILDGSTSRDDWVEGACNGRVPFAQSPQLQRRDFVQNSNDSYWATNPNALLTGYSPLFGPVQSPLTPRTRMGLAMLTKPQDPGLSTVRPAGADGKFSAQDVMDALYSNRAYLAEMLLDELLQRCEAVGADPVNLPEGGSRSVQAGCAALAGWNGVYDIDSRGAHTFRLFAEAYDDVLPDDYAVPFDPADPANTPRQPRPAPANLAEDPMLQALAVALETLDTVGIAYDAPLGAVQRVQLSTAVPPNATPAPAGSPIPWHGSMDGAEGGFNVVEVYTGTVDQDTRFPRLAPADTIPNTSDLSTTPGEGWLIGYGTSWHFGLEFTDDGPRAYGLLSYSQSTDHDSPHFDDQHQLYARKQYRKLLMRDSEIAADPNLVTETVSSE